MQKEKILKDLLKEIDLMELFLKQMNIEIKLQDRWDALNEFNKFLTYEMSKQDPEYQEAKNQYDQLYRETEELQKEYQKLSEQIKYLGIPQE
jgi:Zn-finger nucleic acid-binding protein